MVEIRHLFAFSPLLSFLFFLGLVLFSFSSHLTFIQLKMAVKYGVRAPLPILHGVLFNFMTKIHYLARNIGIECGGEEIGKNKFKRTYTT